MTNPDNQKPVDVEKAAAAAAAEAAKDATTETITKSWKREDMIKKAPPIMRGLGLLFSFLAFILLVSNNHGYVVNYEVYQVYQYVLAIVIISTLYTLWQTFVHFSKIELFDIRTSLLFDFSADQIVAYFLISAASSAIPLTNIYRNIQVNVLTDIAAAVISMAFFAFVSLSLSALFSGYKLSTHSYI